MSASHLFLPRNYLINFEIGHWLLSLAVFLTVNHNKWMYYTKLNDEQLMLLRVSSINSFIMFNSSGYPAYPRIELDPTSCFSGDRSGHRYFCGDRGLERSVFQVYGKYQRVGFMVAFSEWSAEHCGTDLSGERPPTQSQRWGIRRLWTEAIEYENVWTWLWCGD